MYRDGYGKCAHGDKYNVIKLFGFIYIELYSISLIN